MISRQPWSAWAPLKEKTMPEFLNLHSKTTKVLRALAEAAMQRHGLHLGQDHLLALLWERDGQTPGEIAAALRVTAPTVVKMATRMSVVGLLTRRREDRDNRLVRIWLTEPGRELQKPIEAERELIESQITAGLTPIERELLLTALGKVQRSASALLEGPAEPAADDEP
jgi:DNA-binding MarR family transcriptional regulator